MLLRLIACTAFVMAAFAGCLADPGSGATAPETPAPGVRRDVAYGCPAGETIERTPGVCIGTLASVFESYQEADLAIDPWDPSRIALSVNAAGTRVGMGETSAWGPHGSRVAVFVSEDGGATWRDTHFPPPAVGPGDRPGGGDSRVVFGPDGTLHAIGLVSIERASGAYEFGAAYASSADLRDWSEPVFVGGNRNADFPLFAGGGTNGLAIAWYELRDGTWGFTFARSLDGGVTWETAFYDDCWISEAVFVGDVIWLVCPVVDAAWNHLDLRVLRWEPDQPAPEMMKQLGWPGFDRMDLYHHEEEFVAVLVTDENGILTSRSTDGVEWSEPIDVLAASTVDDAPPPPIHFGNAVDPHGIVHVLLSWQECVRNYPVWTCPEGGVMHVAWDPVAGEVLSEMVLSPPNDPVPSRVPPPLEPGLHWGDDYAGLALHEDGGLLAWGEDRGVDFTRLEFPVRE